MSLPDFIYDSAAYLRERGIPESMEAAVILGSGLGSFANRIKEANPISYDHIPHIPTTSVKGHEGNLIVGKVRGKNVIAFSGRFHFYEGFSFEQTAIPVYLAKAFDAKKLIISNAVGAVNTSFKVGDLMIIDDVLRQNMRTTPAAPTPHRYNHYATSAKATDIAANLGLHVQRGTYLFAKGPNYETKAEIRAFRVMGADTVGMSTAPELLEAARLKLKSVAVSLITNMAAGIGNLKLNHEEVKQAAASRRHDFAQLVTELIEKL